MAFLKYFPISQISFLSFFCILSNSLFSEIPEAALHYFPSMNDIYHPVSTTNWDAQQSFDKGLTYTFAYNHDLAFREFEKAAKLDPNLAMAYWGMALALGQNVNEDVTPEKELRCYQYIQKALLLYSYASLSEQAYISALATRYTNDPNADFIPLRSRYREAMKKVVLSYPEDLDAATLYAESILNLDPWKWWTLEGKPLDGVMEAIDVLEFVLARNPKHVGANHFYIHAFEESPYPERALMSAHRLEYLLPDSGHLLHMPCHIFILVGDYESAVKTSKKAVAQDKAYINKFGMSAGSYPLHYLTHNLLVFTRVYMLMEDYENAIKTSLEAVAFIEPHIQSMPTLAAHLVNPLEIYLYFHKWNEILDFSLKVNYPPAEAYSHYSRAMAFAALGDLVSAKKEKDLMNEAKNQITSVDEIAKNPTLKIIELATFVLDAALARAGKNNEESIEYLQKAVKLQESFFYDEPPAWTAPVQQKLGFAYLQQMRFTEAEMAFRKALKSLQRNGRTLFGLYLSLKGQGRTTDAYWIQREMVAALKHATVPLKLQEM